MDVLIFTWVVTVPTPINQNIIIMSAIKVTPNRAKRTFTIRRYDNNGKCYAKYRTISYNAREFASMEYNTEND